MKLFIIISLISFKVFSCPQVKFDQNSSFTNFSQSFSALIDNQVCENLKNILDDTQYQDELKNLVQNQTNEIWDIKGRHNMGNALNQCNPDSSSKALVISFAGTGAYNPRTHLLMAKLIQCPNTQKLSKNLKDLTYYRLLQILKEKKSMYTKWSGLDQGAMTLFLSDPELNKKAKNFNFAIFASEESELIADPEKINTSSPATFYRDVIKSVAGFPAGILNALTCTMNYFKVAKELNIKPKLIIQSHSSGGRSVVKFLEHLKKYVPNQDADLVLTYDPVKEAHHAIGEVADQYAGKVSSEVLDYIPFYESEPHDKPVNVWSRKQPESLYKTSNTKRWVNFYQNEDNEGINFSIKFGIHGSPIIQADINRYIKDIGDKGHGDITYNGSVLKEVKSEIFKIFP